MGMRRGGEEGAQCDARVVKGRREPLNPFYKEWVWAHRPFHSRINHLACSSRAQHRMVSTPRENRGVVGEHQSQCMPLLV
jgi:hypothetical protein